MLEATRAIALGWDTIRDALKPGLRFSEITALGRDTVFVLNALTFLASAELIRRIRRPLSRAREASGGAPVVICLHDHEVVPSVPADEHDVVVDAVLRPATGLVGVPLGIPGGGLSDPRRRPALPVVRRPRRDLCLKAQSQRTSAATRMHPSRSKSSPIFSAERAAPTITN